MTGLIHLLHASVRKGADGPRVSGDDLTLDTRALLRELDLLLPRLVYCRPGLLLDNGPAWVVADLAALQLGLVCVPLPPFFSDRQLGHVIVDAGLDRILTEDPRRVEGFAFVTGVEALRVAGRELALVHVLPLERETPPGTLKVSYTSGTTGAPRGACLDGPALARVTASLQMALRPDPGSRFLSLLPLSLLLENLAAWTALAAGAQICVPSLVANSLDMAQIGPPALARAVSRFRPHYLVLVPQLLRLLLAAVRGGWRPPSCLRFVALGGARVGAGLVLEARALGLPVYEGYGLTEAASVVSLNTPAADRPGSVGRPLGHARVRLAADGEILVGGALFRGYLGDSGEGPGALWATGDLGHIDEAGHLYVEGRKRHVFITAFGRNLSPEWLEAELSLSSAVAQAHCHGEGRPWNLALLVPAPGAGREDLEAAVTAANARLPEYARIGRWLALERPFSVAAGELSGNGRPRREVIEHHYADLIDHCYEEETDVVL